MRSALIRSLCLFGWVIAGNWPSHLAHFRCLLRVLLWHVVVILGLNARRRVRGISFMGRGASVRVLARSRQGKKTRFYLCYI